MMRKYTITDEWSFGDDKITDRLLSLVVSHQKTATTGLCREGSHIPKVGDYGAILDSNGKRRCIIQYTDIAVKPFLDVAYEFVLREGEGDKSIDEWRRKHRKYFSMYDSNFSDASLVVCEQFRLIEVVQEEAE